MKKVLTLLLALLVVCSMATVAFAETETGNDEVATSPNTVDFTKTYTVNGASNDTLYPEENLIFTVAADGALPENKMISIADGALVEGSTNQYKVAITGRSTNIAITVPEYTKAGKYNYIITESKEANGSAGVTYSGVGTQVKVQVFVYWNEDHTALLYDIAFSNGEAGSKIQTIANVYNVGTLTITKEVTGNLGDRSQAFEMDVTFSSTLPVVSTITVTDGNSNTTAGDTTTIAPADWTAGAQGGYTATAAITVSHGETVTISDIPYGVSYTVTEDGKYAVDATFEPNDGSKDYTVNYEGQSGTIEAASGAAAKVINHKESTVDTGVITDSAPYVLLIAVCLGAAVLFLTKRRSVEF